MKKSMTMLVMLMTAWAGAQVNADKATTYYFWTDANLAIGNNGVADLGLNVNLDEMVYTLEFQEIADGLLCLFCSEPPTTLTSVNLLVGKMWKAEISYISLAGGLGVGKHKDPYQSGEFNALFFSVPEYSYNTSTIIGVPLQVKAGIAARVVSLQMKAGVNLNSEMSTFHIGLGIGFGKFF